MKTSIAAFVVAIEEFLAATPRPAARPGPAAHQRRGRPRRRRHGGRVQAAGRTRRDARLLHRRRADLGRALRRHDQERPPRHHERQAHGQGRAGPHRLSAPGAATRSTWSRRRWPSWSRSTRGGWDAGNAFFQPTSWQISNIHARHRRQQRDPRQRGDRLQLPLLDRVARPSRCSSACRRCSTRTGSTTRSPGPSAACPSSPRPASWSSAVQAAIRDETGIETELSTSGGTSDAPLHRARSARRWSSSARSTPASTRSTSTSRWPRSSRSRTSTGARSSGSNALAMT